MIYHAYETCMSNFFLCMMVTEVSSSKTNFTLKFVCYKLNQNTIFNVMRQMWLFFTFDTKKKWCQNSCSWIMKNTSMDIIYRMPKRPKFKAHTHTRVCAGSSEMSFFLFIYKKGFRLLVQRHTEVERSLFLTNTHTQTLNLRWK